MTSMRDITYKRLNAYLNKKFLDTFREDHPNLVELVEEWWNEDMDFTQKDNRLYLIQYFKEPYQLLASMICRLYGKETCMHFKLEWTPLAYFMVDKGRHSTGTNPFGQHLSSR
jgi:hypothetical protein